MTLEPSGVIGIAAAALGGLAVGLEREWSGHATGPGAHFGGIRTFTLLGGLAGLAGWLWGAGYELLAAIMVAGGAALVVAAYVAASRRAIDGTTEVAALVVLAAGVLAGTDHLVLASAVIAVTNLLLVEKSRLHAMVTRIDDAELRAGIRFAVMAVVILPLLPPGPYGPFGGIRPRELWAFVLLFSGLSFAGYLARRLIGSRGYSITGLMAGFVSSTGVTLLFARASVAHAGIATSLAFGVTAACTVMFVRVMVATAILHWPLTYALVPYVVAPLLVGGVVTAVGVVRVSEEEGQQVAASTNPLEFWGALQMALLFQGVLFLVAAVREVWGSAGLLLSGAVVGFTDVDALTISMARSAARGAALDVAARALAIGMLANGVLKLLLALLLGERRFAGLAGLGIAAIIVASAVPLVLLW